jgi:hypothetical protein
LDAFCFVFRTLVVFEDKRLAPDRPVHVGEIALCQPSPAWAGTRGRNRSPP